MEEIPKKQLWQKYLKLDENCLNTKFKKLNKGKTQLNSTIWLNFRKKLREITSRTTNLWNYNYPKEFFLGERTKCVLNGKHVCYRKKQR